jgi:molybdopterin-guanine dinucleotide biosynthesis protein A
MNFSAVILAGGKSSRMGRDKAWLEICGQTLLARQIKLARESGAGEVLISGRPEINYSEFGCRVLLDRFVGAGPLAGIERALEAATSPLLLVLAVDLPAMGTVFLRRLAAASTEHFGAIPRLAGRLEPLAAFYPKTSWLLAETQLWAEHNAAETFARHCVQSGLAQWIELSAAESRFFANWNSPADFSPDAPGVMGRFAFQPGR